MTVRTARITVELDPELADDLDVIAADASNIHSDSSCEQFAEGPCGCSIGIQATLHRLGDVLDAAAAHHSNR